MDKQEGFQHTGVTGLYIHRFKLHMPLEEWFLLGCCYGTQPARHIHSTRDAVQPGVHTHTLLLLGPTCVFWTLGVPVPSAISLQAAMLRLCRSIKWEDF